MTLAKITHEADDKSLKKQIGRFNAQLEKHTAAAGSPFQSLPFLNQCELHTPTIEHSYLLRGRG
ncbi:MAG: hypothetical protein ABGZ23_27650 [Fuerstiella sp.]|nr:hypothetical protein [Fuerstiella sp.]